MPLQLGDLQTDSKTITVQYNELEADVTFRPSAMTAALEQRADEEQWQKGRQIGALALIISEAVIEWDLYDGDERIPTDFDTVKELPAPWLMAVRDAIIEGATEGNASSGSFAAT